MLLVLEGSKSGKGHVRNYAWKSHEGVLAGGRWERTNSSIWGKCHHLAKHDKTTCFLN